MSQLERMEEVFRTQMAKSEGGGGDGAIAGQHAKGRYTARERMDLLFDKGTFERIFALRGPKNSGDGVVAGHGRVNGRRCFAYAWDVTQFTGTCSLDNGRAIAEVIDLARKQHCPLIGLNDSGGARVQDGVDGLFGYGMIFNGHIDASGYIPQLSAIIGPCAGGAVYGPALGDWIGMSRDAFFGVTGPAILKAVTGKDVTMDELGGWEVHATRSGRVNFVERDDCDVIAQIRELIGFLPSSCYELPPYQATKDPMTRPTDLSREIMRSVLQTDGAFDIRVIVKDIVDDGRFFEMSGLYAPNLVTGFARLAGWPIGVIANNSNESAGNLDPASAKKGARFVQFCDRFHIPLVTLCDVAGFRPSIEDEAGDIEGFGALFLHRYRVAKVPKMSVVVRRAFGGAYDVMSYKLAGTIAAYAWPCARFAVMGAAGAVDLLQRKELAAIRKEQGEEAFHQRRAELIAKYNEDVVTPRVALERGFIDAIIEISETRQRLATVLDDVMQKEAKIPQHFIGPVEPI